MNEHSEITKERDQYRQVYDFMHLKFYNNTDSYSALMSEFLKLAKNKDPEFLSNLKLLRKKHTKDLKIKNAKEHLKALENDN